MKYKYVFIMTPQGHYIGVDYDGDSGLFHRATTITPTDLVIPVERFCEYELLQHLDPILIFKHFTETTN